MKIPALALAALCCSQVAFALPDQQLVINNANPITINTVTSFGNASILKDSIATVFFSDGTQDQGIFNTSTTSVAFAQTSSFVLVADGTFSDNSRPQSWSISNLTSDRTLIGFEIDGYANGNGHTSFDLPSFVVPNSTPGSNDGVALTLTSLPTFINGLITIEYRNPLALAGSAPVGDLFAKVHVDINFDPKSGVGLGLAPVTQFFGVLSSAKFSTDIDYVEYAALPVPEPSQWSLMLMGFIPLVSTRYRARR